MAISFCKKGIILSKKYTKSKKVLKVFPTAVCIFTTRTNIKPYKIYLHKDAEKFVSQGNTALEAWKNVNIIQEHGKYLKAVWNSLDVPSDQRNPDKYIDGIWA